MLMLMQIFRFLVGFIASEEGVKKQAILPVAWVGAVLMATAVVLSMPDKAQANTCWLNWGCNNAHPYWCKSIFQGNDACGDGWACAKYGSAGCRCKCF